MASEPAVGAGEDGRLRGHCFADWLPLIAARLPASVLSREAVHRLGALTRRIPGGVVGAIEIRLSADDPQVDFAHFLGHAAHVQEIAAWIQPAAVREYLLGWLEVRDEGMPFLWLEFDLDERLPSEAVVFVRTRGIREPRWVTDELVPKLCGHTPGAAQRRAVHRCLEALERPSKLGYVGALGARGSRAVRLELFNFSPSRIVDYMERLGRPDLGRPVSEHLHLLVGADDNDLQYDVVDEVLPRVGVVMSYEGWSGGDPRWRELTGSLAAAGLCAPHKREAVLGWSGYDSARSAGELWPRDRVGTEGFLIRSLSHAKLLFYPDRPPEAKVYLLAGHYLRKEDGRLTNAPGPGRRRG